MARLLPETTVLIWGQRGTAEIQVGSQRVLIEPNTFVTLPSGVFHQGLSKATETVIYDWIHVRTGPVSECRTPRTPDDSEGFLPLCWKPKDSERWELLFRNILMESAHGMYSRLRYHILVQDLVIQVTEALRRRLTDNTEPAVGRLLLVVEENLTDPNFSVKRLADLLHRAPDYVGRTFRRAKGISVGQYLTLRRLELAKILLKDTSETLAVVARRSGFGSLRQFLDHFSAQEGIPPGKWRRQGEPIPVNRK